MTEFEDRRKERMVPLVMPYYRAEREMKLSENCRSAILFTCGFFKRFCYFRTHLLCKRLFLTNFIFFKFFDNVPKVSGN